MFGRNQPRSINKSFLSIFMSRSVRMFVFSCVCMPVDSQRNWVSVCLFVFLSVCLSFCLSICLSVYLSSYPSVCLSGILFAPYGSGASYIYSSSKPVYLHPFWSGRFVPINVSSTGPRSLLLKRRV